MTAHVACRRRSRSSISRTPSPTSPAPPSAPFAPATAPRRPPLGALALYLTLVALGGEQRDEFPDGNRKMARASQGELAKLSGLSVSSVKRAISALTAAGLVSERQQPQHAMKTTAVYRLIDPSDSVDCRRATNSERPHARPTDRPQPHRRQLTTRPTDRPQRTDDSPRADRPTAHSATNRPLSEPACAHVNASQTTTDQQNQPPSGAEQQRTRITWGRGCFGCRAAV